MQQGFHSITEELVGKPLVIGQPNPSLAKLRQALQRVWSDHVIYTRLYVISFLEGLPDLDVVTKRLMKNQEDIGREFAQYYGSDAGKKITELLKAHINIASNLITSLKNKDRQSADKWNKEWTRNADQIAMALNKINPYWKQNEMRSHLNKHLELTSNEISAHLTKDYVRELLTFDRVMSQAIDMANIFTSGIRKQFPRKF